MISHVKGILDHIDDNKLIIDVDGIGYAVNVPKSLLSSPPKPGEEIKLFTYQVVREDMVALYGFSNRREKSLFSKLISVNGIGPKAAMSIISDIPLDKLITGIAEGNIDLIASVRGVGRKTAERLVIDLKEKIAKSFSVEPSKGASQMAGGDPSIKDAISALMTLGYSSAEAKKAIENAAKDLTGQPSVEDVIKKALSVLA